MKHVHHRYENQTYHLVMYLVLSVSVDANYTEASGVLDPFFGYWT